MADKPDNNIISFEDVKRMASDQAEPSGRPSVSGKKKAKVTRSASKAAEQEGVSEPSQSATVSSSFRKIDAKTPAGASGAVRPSVSGRVVRVSARGEGSLRGGLPANQAGAPSSSDGPDASAAMGPVHSNRAWRRTANNAPLAGDTSRVPQRADQVERFDDQQERLEGQQERPRFSGRIGNRAAQKTKQRAGKLYDKQFGASEASGTDAGPRAAVYKGSMGKSHKKALETLGEAKTGVVSGVQGLAASIMPEPTSNDAPRRAKSGGTPAVAVVIGIALVVLFLVVFLYPSAQQYYVELRTHQKLEAEYDAVMSHNDAIQEKIDALATDEGIEDEAHTQLGWVKEGETSVTVEGLDDGWRDGAEAGQAESADANVEADGAQEGDEAGGDAGDGPRYESKSVVEVMPTSDDIPAPTTWYSPFLDWLFGYDPDPGATKAAEKAAREAQEQAEAESAAADEAEEPTGNQIVGLIRGDEVVASGDDEE